MVVTPRACHDQCRSRKIVDTSDEWITTRTGIKERHIAADDQAASDMAYEAAKVALADAGMDASELTHIVCGTFTPDSMVPSTACRIQEKFGIKGQACVDIAAACSGLSTLWRLHADTLPSTRTARCWW